MAVAQPLNSNPSDFAKSRLDLLGAVDQIRRRTNLVLDQKRKSDLGQFMTPASVARLMASMIGRVPSEVRILDAGAGTGSLAAAAVAELLSKQERPLRIQVTAFEIDDRMADGLLETFRLCSEYCRYQGVEFEGVFHHQDFLEYSASLLLDGLFQADEEARYDLAIQNPPYKKIHSASAARAFARSFGIETSNLYTAFLASTIGLLKSGGQLIAISPRSFCNGPYFRPFRELLLRRVALERIHLFESRQRAFKDDEVLQETVIISARIGSTSDRVTISSSADATSAVVTREIPASRVVSPTDPQSFIHITANDAAERAAGLMASLPSTLKELGISVSTGRVVDFRAREHLRAQAGDCTVPLIYPAHLAEGAVIWPRAIRKPNALHYNPQTESLVVPNGPYVLTKRFSAKEEKRRIVAAVFELSTVPSHVVGFENHLNYFHACGQPLDIELAHGLAAFLNCTVVDTFFRQFNGHTQVNATDLRALRYPSKASLRMIGKAVVGVSPTQAQLDDLVEGIL